MKYAAQERYRKTAKGKAASRRYYEKSKHRPRMAARRLLHSARQRAKTKGLECTLTIEYIERWLVCGVCEITGLPFSDFGDAGGFYRPSLDRIDQTKGYTPQNTQIVLWGYNRLKNNASDSDTIEFIKSLHKALI